MTLEQLEATLPNGLHDSLILALTIDYVASEARFSLDVDTSDETHETQRPAQMILSGLVFCVIDPPDSRYVLDLVEPLWIDAGPFPGLRSLPPSLPPLPEGVFGHYFFLQHLNCFIYVAARDARLEWTGEEIDK